MATALASGVEFCLSSSLISPRHFDMYSLLFSLAARIPFTIEVKFLVNKRFEAFIVSPFIAMTGSTERKTRAQRSANEGERDVPQLQFGTSNSRQAGGSVDAASGQIFGCDDSDEAEGEFNFRSEFLVPSTNIQSNMGLLQESREILEIQIWESWDLSFESLRLVCG